MGIDHEWGGEGNEGNEVRGSCLRRGSGLSEFGYNGGDWRGGVI